MNWDKFVSTPGVILSDDFGYMGKGSFTYCVTNLRGNKKLKKRGGMGLKSHFLDVVIGERPHIGSTNKLN